MSQIHPPVRGESGQTVLSRVRTGAALPGNPSDRTPPPRIGVFEGVSLVAFRRRLPPMVGRRGLGLGRSRVLSRFTPLDGRSRGFVLSLGCFISFLPPSTPRAGRCGLGLGHTRGFVPIHPWTSWAFFLAFLPSRTPRVGRRRLGRGLGRGLGRTRGLVPIHPSTVPSIDLGLCTWTPGARLLSRVRPGAALPGNPSDRTQPPLPLRVIPRGVSFVALRRRLPPTAAVVYERPSSIAIVECSLA